MTRKTVKPEIFMSISVLAKENWSEGYVKCLKKCAGEGTDIE
jgi:hypothetical protein